MNPLIFKKKFYSCIEKWKKVIQVAMLMPTLLCLCSCKTNSQKENAKLNIYQASVLKIKAGTKIETFDGSIYIPQTDELWFSRYFLFKQENLKVNKENFN